MRAIAIDFETANERRDSACAVGLAWIEDGRVTHRAYSLVRPREMRFEPGNMRVHGIRPDDVQAAPDLPRALEPFMADLASTLILAHNAAFDVAVLCGTLAAHGEIAPRLTYICTRTMARRAWPHESRFGLAALAAKVGVSFRHHHAEEDAHACARVALAAAAQAGTDRIGEAADRLGIRPGLVDGPLRERCVSARFDRREVRRPPAPEIRTGRLAFSMRGSRGDRYDIVGTFAGRGYALRCTCMAGRHRLRCRHVTALLDGEVTDLVSDNLYDVEKLRVVVQALGMAAVEPIASVVPLAPGGSREPVPA